MLAPALASLALFGGGDDLSMREAKSGSRWLGGQLSNMLSTRGGSSRAYVSGCSRHTRRTVVCRGVSTGGTMRCEWRAQVDLVPGKGLFGHFKEVRCSRLSQ
jgi:hypothetical protein